MLTALALAAAASGSPAPLAAAQWSPPAVLGACSADVAPGIAFPDDKPNHATGPGAIVWSASSRCRGGAGARIAAIGVGDRPGPSLAPRTAAGAPLAPAGQLTVAGAPHGDIVIAGASAGVPAEGLLIEGAAGGPFAPLAPSGAAAPVALANAYRGDLALAAAEGRDGGVRVQVQPRFAAGFDRSVAAGPAGGGSPGALSVAMDFRGDALAVWAEDGTIYARDLPVSGAKGRLQRLARVGAGVTLSALLSDDNRAIVAWVQQRGATTSVYLDQSDTGVRFTVPRLLERFSDPDGIPSPAASPRLVRLSSESVMLAWASAAGGRWAIDTAAIDQQGLRTVGTIAAPGRDELLADLAPGPLGEALLLWTEPQPGTGGQAIFSARGTESAPGRTYFGEPEQLAPAGPNSDARVAFDPSSDRAVAVWRDGGTAIEYAVRSSSPGP